MTDALKKDLIKGSSLLFCMQGGMSVLGILSTLILARLLTPDDFGVVAIATAFIGLIEAFSSISLSAALIAQRELNDDHFDSAWTMGLIRGIVVAALIVLCTHPVAEFASEPRLTNIMFVLAIFALLRSIKNPKYVILEKKLSYTNELVITLSVKILALLAATLVAYYFKTYWAMIIALCITNLLTVIFEYIAVPYRPKPSLKKFNDIWKFTSWLTLGSIAAEVNNRFDALLVGIYIDRATLGLYDVGDNLAKRPTEDILQPLRRPLFPVFSQLRNDRARVKSAYIQSQQMLFAIAIPFGVGFSLVADIAVTLALGEKWLGAIFVIQVLSINFALQSFTSPTHALAQAFQKTRYIFNAQMVFFIIRIPLISIGLVLGGLAGLVYMRFFTGLINIAIYLKMAEKIIGITFFSQIKTCWRSAVSAIIMSISVIGLRAALPESSEVSNLAIQFALCIILGTFSYIFSHFAIWTFNGRPAGVEREIIAIISRTKAAKYIPIFCSFQTDI